MERRKSQRCEGFLSSFLSCREKAGRQGTLRQCGIQASTRTESVISHSKSQLAGRQRASFFPQLCFFPSSLHVPRRCCQGRKDGWRVGERERARAIERKRERILLPIRPGDVWQQKKKDGARSDMRRHVGRISFCTVTPQNSLSS